ncbi:MAG: response regulator [Gallionella sp.]|nr:response regulator [Gallionella sp.]
MNDTTVTTSSSAAVAILCVDDEPNILSALKRLLHRQGYRVSTAESGAEGLQVLEQQPVDLVLSDMRMPQMDGAQFLEQVRQRWPDTVRVLLTGYADVESTMAAINKGEIYRYIAKPWDDNDVLFLVKHAMERKALEAEKRRLEALTQRQNEELKSLNASLEIKVQQRTKELQLALQGLEKSNEQLRKNFLTSVSIFSNLMELRSGGIGGHSRRVAELARDLALQIGIPHDEVQNVVLASLLHDIGKIGLSDVVLNKPEPLLTDIELAQLKRHPVVAAAALIPLDQLKAAAVLIRSHHECFDGRGYPEKLSGSAIPLGARVLLLANDFDALQYGHMLGNPLSPAKAYEFILDASGKRYDPAVVNAFKGLFAGKQLRDDAVPHARVEASKPKLATPKRVVSRKIVASSDVPQDEVAVEMSSADLRPGMVLAKGVISREGLLLMFRDDELDSALIEQMIKFEQAEKYALSFWVRPSGSRWLSGSVSS